MAWVVAPTAMAVVAAVATVEGAAARGLAEEAWEEEATVRAAVVVSAMVAAGKRVAAAMAEGEETASVVAVAARVNSAPETLVAARGPQIHHYMSTRRSRASRSAPTQQSRPSGGPSQLLPWR